MNIKELILPVILTLVTMWGINNWLFRSADTINSCSQSSTNSFIAPVLKAEQTHKPLKKDVDFLDKHLSVAPSTELVSAPWGNIEFSSMGAVIDSIEFYRSNNRDACPIRTIFPKSLENVGQGALLLAFENETPLDYSLVDRHLAKDSVSLTYRAKTKVADIRKTFIIDTQRYKIDLRLQVTPLGQGPLEYVRVLYPSPVMSDIVSTDVISSVLIDNDQQFKKNISNKIDMQMGWFSPSAFGSDDRYFLHAFIGGTDRITRSYYKTGVNNELISILELPTIEKPIDITLSFYFGPKQYEGLFAVDPRLEDTLEYAGFFAPVAKLLLAILKWLESYLHNFGLAIIVFSLFIQFLLLPLTTKREQAMKQQQEIQKKMSYLKMKYKNDPERLNAENAELLRQQGMGNLVGCLLPPLLQMPIFFGLRNVLSGSLEFYKAPMLWIPDLSASDPYYILTILFVGPMIIQALKQKDSKQTGSSILMALVFGAFTTSLASGSLLYMTVGSLFSAAQAMVMKMIAGSRGK